jgi:hypothetical protein
VDGLACYLHHPTVCIGQTRGHSILTGVVPSRHAVVSGAPFRGVQGRRNWVFDVVLTVRVSERSNLMWRRPLLPGHAYPLSELSW